MEIKKFRGKEELEFELFQEVDLGEEQQQEEKKVLGNINVRGDDIVTILKILDGKAICKIADKEEFMIIDGLEEEFLKEGETFLVDDGENIIPIEKDVLDLKFLKEMEAKLDGEEIALNELTTVLTKEYIIQSVGEKILEKDKESEEDKQREIERRNDRINKEERDKQDVIDFNNGKLILSSISVIGKEIILEDGSKYTLADAVNKILTLVYIKSELNYRSWRQKESLRDYLVEHKISFGFDDNSAGRLKYNLEFDEIIGTTLNNKRISKNKVKFLLEKISNGTITNDDQIEMLNKLSGMKYDLLNMKKVDLRENSKEYDLDISFRMMTPENFEMEFIDVKKILPWDKIKGWFFGSGRSCNGYMHLQKLMEIGTGELGLTKQDIYDYLKSVVILANLKNDEKN